MENISLQCIRIVLGLCKIAFQPQIQFKYGDGLDEVETPHKCHDAFAAKKKKRLNNFQHF